MKKYFTNLLSFLIIIYFITRTSSVIHSNKISYSNHKINMYKMSDPFYQARSVGARTLKLFYLKLNGLIWFYDFDLSNARLYLIKYLDLRE